MQVLFIVLAIIVLLLWGWRQLRRHSKQSTAQTQAKQPLIQKSETEDAAASAPEPEEPSSMPADVKFRMQGERGMGGPVYGDVLCSDGVYLPQVWESDFHTSFDGRWIRTGSYGGATPRLLDRKSRRSWQLSVAEAALVDDLHWRLPRWSGESEGGNGIAADTHSVLTDTAFEAWLSKHVSQKAQALVPVCDLWVPVEYIPDEAQAPALQIPQPDNAVVQVTVQRFWPASLRELEHPLEPLFTPYWQLQINGETQSWVIDCKSPCVWRPDGQAFACYGYPITKDGRKPSLRLGVWSQAFGGQQWSEWLPQDRKPWAVMPCLPAETETEQALPALMWDVGELLQRVEMDTPELERLHDGRHLSCVMSQLYATSRHLDDGRVRLKPIPARQFLWRRDLHHPNNWVAQSEPVAGLPLLWTLVHDAQDERGATAAYTVQWGEQQLPGLWELEHVVVDGRWALLCPWGESPLKGGKPVPWVWDGKQLNTIEMNWPVLRMRPHVKPGHAQALVIVGCGPDNSNLSSSGLWRWPLQLADATNLSKQGWMPAYEWRDLAVNAQGIWQLLPRWREVQQIQHPSADGDYVWRYPAVRDAVWWWGGLHNTMSSQWRPKAPRCEGVLVTQSGAVLCGVGPSICPHYAGDGWLVLEWLARGQNDEANHWKVHWLRPKKHEVLTLELRAYLPVLQSWNAQQGLTWIDTGLPAPDTQTDDATASPHLPSSEQVIAPMRWEEAQLEVLKQSPVGLWVRKQDAVYADAIVLRDDWPWNKPQPPAAQRT